MISKKVFNADGTTTRYLSDFIIRSEQFARVYCYHYDQYGIDGYLQFPAEPWAYPTNLYIRSENVAKSDDLITIDKWDVVDNSILFYEAPEVNTSVYLEVASTPEEFGDTLTQPSVEAAEQAAINAANSASQASQSAVNAYDSELSAAGEAFNASVSAYDASQSETAAGISSANAATSETNAAASETNAATSEANAATSASDALDSEVSAASSAATATTQANQAGDSSIAAATSATNAAVSADDAAASAAAFEIITGSSGNTEWTKFPDGTMLQWNHALATNSSGNNTLSYPQPFISPPTVSLTVQRTDNFGLTIQLTALSATGHSIHLVNAQNNTTFVCTYQYLAIGRWK